MAKKNDKLSSKDPSLPGLRALARAVEGRDGACCVASVVKRVFGREAVEIVEAILSGG